MSRYLTALLASSVAVNCNAGRFRQQTSNLKSGIDDFSTPTLHVPQSTLPDFLSLDESLDESASSAHASIKIMGHDGDHLPEGHAPGGSYNPDLTLHDFLHMDDGNENKLKSIGEGLASGTAEILLAMFEHQGTAHKLHDLARDSSGHKLATSFIDMSVLEEHGLSQHELVTVHAVAGSMNERIFQKLKRGGSAGGDAHCPSKPEIGEEGGSGFIADAVSSDKGASDKYLVDVQKPTNYDPR